MNLTRLTYYLVLSYFSFYAPFTSANEDKSLLPTTFTVRGSEGKLDSRYDYDIELLSLALEKTRASHGPYALITSPTMNFSRAVYIAKKNQLHNFILKLSYTSNEYDGLVFADFPVDLGIAGYRVCFTNGAALRKLSKNRSMQRLQRLVFGVGSGWTEAKIFRHNKLRTMEIPLYESMFTMLNEGRYDLFCRGANEIYNEWKIYNNLKNFKLERSIGFHYPLPRFFYTHKSNKKGIQRIEQGLKLAYEDGSLQKLWLKYYQHSVKFSNLESRQIVKLKNPDLEGLSDNYKKYLFNPL